jgi:2'-5' RNA ligase
MSIRTFIAVPLPEELKRAIHNFGQGLVEKGLRIRLVRPEGIHCTLRFLGDVEEEKVKDIGTAMERAIKGVIPTKLYASGIGVFPHASRPRVIWVGVKGELKQVERLFLNLQNELEGLGFEREKRGFSPHLTIGRWKAPLNSFEKKTLKETLKEHGEWNGGEFDLKEVVLYKSQLHPSGARYTPLSRIPIG